MTDRDVEMMQVDFELVTDTYISPSEVRRRGAGCDVERSGYTETNTNGTVEFNKLMTLTGGKAEDQFTIKFGANEAKGMIAAYLAKDGEDGATTAKTTTSPTASTTASAAK